MNEVERIEIPLSKGKLIIILLLSIIFFAIGLWFIISPPEMKNSNFDIPTLFWVSGVALILFFGFCGVVIIKKLRDKTPGLIIDKSGIIDNSRGIPAGHIPWKDIVQIKSMKVFTQNFLIIIVRHPDIYINRQTKAPLKKAMEFNNKNYGSPITISESSLKCNFKELEKILQTEFNKNKYN